MEESMKLLGKLSDELTAIMPKFEKLLSEQGFISLKDIDNAYHEAYGQSIEEALGYDEGFIFDTNVGFVDSDTDGDKKLFMGKEFNIHEI